MVFSTLFKKKSYTKYDKQICDLYTHIVKSSRREVFFTDLEVADTVEGRFDMIVLHAFCVLRRLRQETDNKAVESFSQAFFDLWFDDMDLNLRELGVGDMGLARRVPKMMEAFYGRATVYEEALSKEDNIELKAALDRNLYRKTPVSDESLEVMAQYLRQECANVEKMNVEEILKGKMSFGLPVAGKETTND